MLRYLRLILFTATMVAAPLAARADDFKPDDRVVYDIAAEDWVSTKTARVVMNVEAAVTDHTAGTTRDGMMNALESLVKTDWRLISFNRSQDQTGLERWSAAFEARVPEGQLAGIHDNVKKVSKPGMQVSVAGIDFSPTLDEVQIARNQLRVKIYKMANDQLAALNAALPGRGYRIALIDFTQDDNGGGVMAPAPKFMRASKAMLAGAEAAISDTAASPSMERSQKLVLSANVIFAVTPATTAAAK